jgi:hypothetical protein
MSIEKTTGVKNYYVYRINPYNDRQIERKPNKRYGKWERVPYATYATPEEARTAWRELGKGQAK